MKQSTQFSRNNVTVINNSDVMPQPKLASDVCIVKATDGSFWRYIPSIDLGSWWYEGSFKSGGEAMMG